MSNKSRGCQGKDTFQRMNFLCQASSMMAGQNDVLSCYYGSLCKSISRKAVLRMEPTIKRHICKRCNITLKAGLTATIDVDKHDRIFTLTCNKCLFKRNFVINKNYNLWLDNKESISEVQTFRTVAPNSNGTVPMNISAPKTV